MYPRDSPCNCMQLFFMKKAGLRKQWNFANEDIYYPEWDKEHDRSRVKFESWSKNN